VKIGPYYADIACHHARLIIEADGATHSSDEELAHDDRRDRYLRSRGFRVLRFWNHDFADNAAGVGEAILRALAGIEPLAPTPSPSPRGGGGLRRRKLRTGLAELTARTGGD
jgi:very-short-patch-repair endonuclease